MRLKDTEDRWVVNQLNIICSPVGPEPSASVQDMDWSVLNQSQMGGRRTASKLSGSGSPSPSFF